MLKKVVNLKNSLPISEVGGKAHSLSVLFNNGFNVPQGFVVTSAAFFDFLEHNDLLNEVQKLTSEITQDNFKEKSAQARKIIFKGEIPKNIASEIEEFLNELGAKYVSIRSSAVSEDGLKSSFAGLFDTFLSTKADLPVVLENVKRCFASLFNERAVIYRIRNEFPHLEGMAVVVQRMIPAETSGVAFTVHPSNEKSLLIEASYGFGDIIVSGKIEPDDYVVDRKILKVTDKRIGNKSKMSICQDGEIKVVDVKDKDKKRPVLSDRRIKEIAKTCLKVEKIFKYPQDIEWCISNDKLWLLQSRAITKVKT